jgi:hypothetical protein
MTSLKQIEANRRNALNSTGPRTLNGKQASRRNALRHGFTAETVIEPLENLDEYRTLLSSRCSSLIGLSQLNRQFGRTNPTQCGRQKRAVLVKVRYQRPELRFHRQLASRGLDRRRRHRIRHRPELERESRMGFSRLRHAQREIHGRKRRRILRCRGARARSRVQGRRELSLQFREGKGSGHRKILAPQRSPRGSRSKAGSHFVIAEPRHLRLRPLHRALPSRRHKQWSSRMSAGGHRVGPWIQGRA